MHGRGRVSVNPEVGQWAMLNVTVPMFVSCGRLEHIYTLYGERFKYCTQVKKAAFCVSSSVLPSQLKVTQTKIAMGRTNDTFSHFAPKDVYMT